MNTMDFEVIDFIEIVDEETGDTYFYCDDDAEPDWGADVDALLAMITDM
jgi:hypothetical protein